MRRRVEHVRALGADVELAWPTEYAPDAGLCGRAYEPWKLNLAAAAGGRLFVASRDTLLVRSIESYLYFFDAKTHFCEESVVLGPERGSEAHVVNALRPGVLFGAHVLVAACQGGHVFVLPADEPHARARWVCVRVSAPAWSVALAPAGPDAAVLAVGANNRAVTLFRIERGGGGVPIRVACLGVHRHNVPSVDILDSIGVSASIDCSCALWPVSLALNESLADPNEQFSFVIGERVDEPFFVDSQDALEWPESASVPNDDDGNEESPPSNSDYDGAVIVYSNTQQTPYLRMPLDRAWGWTALLLRIDDVARTMRPGEVDASAGRSHTRVFRPHDGGESDTGTHAALERRLTLGVVSAEALVAVEDALHGIDQLDMDSAGEDGSGASVDHDDYPDFSHAIVRTRATEGTNRMPSNSFGALSSHADVSHAHLSEGTASGVSGSDDTFTYSGIEAEGHNGFYGRPFEDSNESASGEENCSASNTASRSESNGSASDPPRGLPRGLLRTWTPETDPNFSRLHSRQTTPYATGSDVLVAATTERRLFIIHAATGRVLRTVDYIDRLYWDVHGPPLDPALLGMSRLSMSLWLPSLSVLVLGCQMGYVAFVHVCMPPEGLSGLPPPTNVSARPAWSGAIGEDVAVVPLPWAYRGEDDWAAGGGAVRPASWLHGLAVVENADGQSAVVLAVDGLGRVHTISISRRKPPSVIT